VRSCVCGGYTRLAHDHLDEVGLAEPLGLDGVDLASVAQDRDPVGDRQHLVEPVADIEDRQTGRGVSAQRVEE
jgi:hypothetical protein